MSRSDVPPQSPTGATTSADLHPRDGTDAAGHGGRQDGDPAAVGATTESMGPGDPAGDPEGSSEVAGYGVRDLVDISAIEVISRAGVMLMSAAAEQLGLAPTQPGRPAHQDLDEARALITALSGLLHAALPDLGPHAAAFRDGLQTLQAAFREASVLPDAPGEGPGEALLR